MPMFSFSDEFSALEQRVFTHAGLLACKELGIDKSNAEIMIRRVDLGEHRKAAITCLDPRRLYLLLIHDYMEPQEIVHVLGHELIHFQQYERGDLKIAVDENAGEDDEAVVIWKGRRFRPVDYKRDGERAYLNQPWEKEAFDKHEKLYIKVACAIPIEDRIALSEEAHENGIDSEVRELLGRVLALFHMEAGRG